MIRKLTILGALAAGLLFSGAATAQEGGKFGDEGQAIISADRVMPLFAYENEKVSVNGGGSSSQTVTSLSLVTHGGTLNTFYNIPRFAFDYTVYQHLTVGGSIYVYLQTGNSTTQHQPGQPDVSTDNSKVTFWGLAPRVGWIFQLSDLFAFWPRGGISFNDEIANHPNNGGSTTVTQWALDLEPMFAITPASHVAITAGGAIDIPLTGSVTDNPNGGASVSVDSTMFHFGLTGGLLIWF
jgi:hypothetical protein